MNAVEQAEKALWRSARIGVPAHDMEERDVLRALESALVTLLAEHKRVLAEREADEDYREVFGTTPAHWREPFGALRLTLSQDCDTCAERDRLIERARSECEALVRVLNDAADPAEHPEPPSDMTVGAQWDRAEAAEAKLARIQAWAEDEATHTWPGYDTYAMAQMAVREILTKGAEESYIETTDVVGYSGRVLQRCVRDIRNDDKEADRG